MAANRGTTRSIVSPHDQSATFIELFFDLVFVFAVTQIVGILHHGLTWATAAQSLLVFWIVWWAWTQFTWALNAADTTHPLVELGTLVATAFAFFMAIALPEAFGERSLWFAAAYLIVRSLGLAIYTWVSWSDASQRRAVVGFASVSIAGMLAVLFGGIVGGAWLYPLWGLAIVLDVLAANSGGRSEGWRIHPEHFAERHGLFMIIALGEALIVAASGAIGSEWNRELIVVAMLAVTATCALWWTYFARAKPVLEHALAVRTGAEQAQAARDIFSLMHFIVLCGVIAFAFAVEEAIAHPADPLPFAGRLALAVGLALFLGGIGGAVWRATGTWLVVRGIATAALALVLLVWAGAPVATLLTVVVAGVVAIALYEQIFDRALVA